jgi:hypothetical protein
MDQDLQELSHITPDASETGQHDNQNRNFLLLDCMSSCLFADFYPEQIWQIFCDAALLDCLRYTLRIQ